MSQREPGAAIAHMVRHAEEAIALVSGRRRRDLDADRILQLALTRLVEIVGEAASRVPDTERRGHVAVPWRAIIGMRNRLIHGYDAVDLDVLWDVVSHDLPELLAALKTST